MPDFGVLESHPLWRTFITWALISDIDLEDQSEVEEWFDCFIIGAKICENMQLTHQNTETGIYMPNFR